MLVQSIESVEAFQKERKFLTSLMTAVASCRSAFDDD
jgi:hypothetical protein